MGNSVEHRAVVARRGLLTFYFVTTGMFRHEGRGAFVFWGPRGRVPEDIYVPALLPIPVLMPVADMVHWLWCLRRKRRSRPGVDPAAREETSIARVSL